MKKVYLMITFVAVATMNTLAGVAGAAGGGPGPCDISGTVGGAINVCINEAEPDIIFTGSGGTSPYTFTYNINGGLNMTVTSSGNNATVTASTDAVGSFQYNLSSVQDDGGCDTIISDSVIVNVTSLPTATISGDTNVCQGAERPYLIFQGNGSNAGQYVRYTFTYSINGGTNQSNTSPEGQERLQLPVSTSVAGRFDYELISVDDNAGCSQAQTGTATVDVNEIPALSSTLSPADVCSGTTFSYTPTSSTGGATYSWSRATIAGITEVGTTGTNTVNETLTNTTTSPIDVTYAYTTTANSCSSTENVVVTVNPTPTLSSTLSPSDIASGSIFSYTATSATAGSTFAWSRATLAGITEAGTTGSGNPNESLTNTTSSTISVTYTYTTSSNGCSGTDNVIVSVLPANTLNGTISGNATVCQDATNPTITFTGSGGTAPYVFTYNINHGANQTITSDGTGAATLLTPTNTAGTDIYYLVSVDDATPITIAISDSAMVIVNSLPTATIATSASPVCLYDNASIIVTGASGTAPYTFSYSINSVAQVPVTTSGGNSAVIPTSTDILGAHVFQLESVSGVNCTSSLITSVVSMTVNPLPSAMIHKDSIICSEEPVIMVAAGGSSPYVFTYSVDGGASVSTTNNSDTLIIPAGNNSGTSVYKLISISDSLGCSNSVLDSCVLTCDSAIVYSTPAPIDSTSIDTLVTSAILNCTIDYAAIDSIVINSFSFVTLDSVAVVWSIYGTTTMNQTAVYPVSQAGFYTFMLDLFCTSRASGNSARAIDQVYITEPILSIGENELVEANVFPNPFTNQLTVEVEQASDMQISDVSGKIVYNGTLSSGTNNINTESFDSGMYIMTISNREGVVNKTILKQ